MTIMEPRLTHAALDTYIQKTRAAAHDHDRVRLRQELERLISAFTEHLALESPTIAELPESLARELRRGQDRITSTLRSLGAEVDTMGEGAHCESLTAQLDALLELQEDAERRAFHKRKVEVDA
jgi:hypothetical protein